MVSKEEHESAILQVNLFQTEIEVAKQKTISLQQEKTDLQNEAHQYKLLIDLQQKEIQEKERHTSTLTANLAAARDRKSVV